MKHRKNMSRPAQSRRARALERLEQRVATNPKLLQRESITTELESLRSLLKTAA